MHYNKNMTTNQHPAYVLGTCTVCGTVVIAPNAVSYRMYLYTTKLECCGKPLAR